MGEPTKRISTRRIELDPEVLLDLVRDGLTLKQACEKVGIKYTTVYGWIRRGKFNLQERVQAAKAVFDKKLAAASVDLLPDKSKPKHLQSFLDHFRLNGEQIAACRFAGITYQAFRDYCDPRHVSYSWWFATEFEALLEEQQMELRDKAIQGALKDPRLASQILRDIERVQKTPVQQAGETAETVSDDQILEALSRIAEKINAPELPPLEPGSVQVAPS